MKQACVSRRPKHLAFSPLVFSLLSLGISSTSHALTYGIYDARGLAMGGAAVAVGTPAQAAFYNPALLAFHDLDEDESRDGRVYLPSIVGQLSSATESAINVLDDELDVQLSAAINDFNASASTPAAAAVSAAAKELRSALDDIANQDLTLDSFIGFNISEPSKREGGAFYVGVRVLGVGRADVSDSDSQLLNNYISAMDSYSQSGDLAQVASQYPGLIDSSEQLVDPTNQLTSSADIGALVISEWGLAIAKEWRMWQQPIAFGITPKLMRVDALRDSADFNSNINSVDAGINQFEESRATYYSFNADLGIATTFADHYRLSFALKDAIAKTFNTQQPAATPATSASSLSLAQRSRMGLAYIGARFSLGLDYDLSAVPPMASEAESQELSLGAEYRVGDGLALQLGYRQDQLGNQGSISSAGIGYRWRRLVMDIAYASGDNTKGGSLQLGWTF
jgi:hypothetical protein